MKNKTLNKLVSVLMVLAICSATVFGCLVTANAASDASYETVIDISSDHTTLTADATFTLPEAVKAGKFTISKTGNPNNAEDCFSSVTVTAIGGTPASGSFSADDFQISQSADELNADNLAAVVVENPDVGYSTLTLRLEFKFAAGTATAGESYAVYLKDLEFSNSDGSTVYTDFTRNGTSSVTVAKSACSHSSVTIDSESVLVKTDAVEGYSVYKNAVCSSCGERFYYQVVPTSAPVSEGNVIYWDGTEDATVADNGEAGTEADPIIIDSAAELAYIANATDAKGSTADKYYKIADGISAIVLQNETIGNFIMDLADSTEVKNYFEKDSTIANAKTWVTSAYNTTKPFQGHFDGNGATIYGMYADYAKYTDWRKDQYSGLFPVTGGGAVISNVAVKNSYLATGNNIGALTSHARNGDGTISFEKVIVANNYISTTANSGEKVSCGGVMAGNLWRTVNVDNCLVYGNIAVNTGIEMPDGSTGYNLSLFGNFSSPSGANTNAIKNSIILGAAPFTQYNFGYGAYHNNHPFENVYTDTYPADNYYYSNGWKEVKNFTHQGVTEVADSDLLGDKAAGIVSALNTANGSEVWSTGKSGSYPVFAKSTGTISSKSSKSLKLAAVNLTYNAGGDFDVNFHYEPASADIAPVLYVTDPDLSLIKKITPVASSKAGEGLSESAVMYTVSGLSARDIDKVLLATAVYSDGNSVLWGKTENISVKDYATAVLSGEGYYTADATEAQKTADKNIAAAVINYGAAAKAALAQGYDGSGVSGKTVYWDGSTLTAPTAGSDGVYVIDSAEKLAYIAKNANSDTAGKTYKVADGISAIVLQPEGDVAKAIIALSDKDTVKTYYEANKSSLKNWVQPSGNNTGFAGTFDGNGATIYGLYSNSYTLLNSLFSGAGGDIAVKNTAVKNSYTWGDAAAVICSFTSTTATLTIENCEIANNVVIANRLNDSITYGGVLFGSCGDCKAIIDGCLIYGNSATHTEYALTWRGEKAHEKAYSINYGLWGAMNRNDSAVNTTVKNSIVLDTAPYAMNHSWAGWNQCKYENVYTNMVDMTIENQDWTNTGATSKLFKTVTTVNGDGTTKLEFYGANATSVTYSMNNLAIYKISAADAMGSDAKTNCPNFDWDSWAYGSSGSYPTMATGTLNSTAGKVIYWDGTADSTLADNGETGTEADPIIIDSAEELFYLARKAKVDETTGKYYKVADGITKIILQKESVVRADELLLLSDSTAVKDYLTGLSGVLNWMDGDNGTFNGNFDGNGVTIYGLYAKGLYCGLFDNVDGGTPDSAGKDNTGIYFKNFAIKNSYYESEWRLGAIFAFSLASANGNKVDGTINVDTFELANCYITNTAGGNLGNKGVVLGGNQSEVYHIKNMIVYGNYTTPASGGVFEFANGDSGRWVNNISGGTRIYNTIENSIVLDTPINDRTASYAKNTVNSFENVFTNMPFSITNNDAAEFKYKDTDVKAITAADVTGNSAKDIVSALNTANGGTVWYVNPWGYPEFKEASAMPSSAQNAYDHLTLSNYDNYTATDPLFSMYATSLNVKANPYIAFTFAFGGEYKENRKDITVTFKNASGNVIKTTTVADANDNLNDGWTNRTGAGRYHLYRLTDVDVKDLAGKITVEVTYGSNAAVTFGTFSVEGFALDLENAYKQDPCSYYATRLEAAKALLFYTQMVNARYGSAS